MECDETIEVFLKLAPVSICCCLKNKILFEIKILTFSTYELYFNIFNL